jgi:ABC-type uncharacterized transport system ATPase component
LNRSPANSWKNKLRLRSSSRSKARAQPLTLEEKLRVAANRVRRFERAPVRQQSRTQARPKPKSRSAKTKAPTRKRDKLQTRLNNLIGGRF